MQDDNGSTKLPGESSLHQQMMEGFLEWVAGLRTITHLPGTPQPTDQWNEPPPEQQKGLHDGETTARDIFQDHS